jgi:hypothetical protein
MQDKGAYVQTFIQNNNPDVQVARYLANRGILNGFT